MLDSYGNFSGDSYYKLFCNGLPKEIDDWTLNELMDIWECFVHPVKEDEFKEQIELLLPKDIYPRIDNNNRNKLLNLLRTYFDKDFMKFSNYNKYIKSNHFYSDYAKLVDILLKLPEFKRNIFCSCINQNYGKYGLFFKTDDRYQFSDHLQYILEQKNPEYTSVLVFNGIDLFKKIDREKIKKYDSIIQIEYDEYIKIMCQYLSRMSYEVIIELANLFLKTNSTKDNKIDYFELFEKFVSDQIKKKKLEKQWSIGGK